MKVGTQTGSLVNHLYSRMTKGQPTPEIGMGVTLLSYTDRSAGTIVSKFTKGKYTYIEVTLDDAKRVDTNGMSEIQEYVYTQRTDAAKYTFRTDAVDGKWQEVYMNSETGRWKNIDGGKGLRIGTRETYHDFSF